MAIGRERKGGGYFERDQERKNGERRNGQLKGGWAEERDLPV